MYKIPLYLSLLFIFGCKEKTTEQPTKDLTKDSAFFTYRHYKADELKSGEYYCTQICFYDSLLKYSNYRTAIGEQYKFSFPSTGTVWLNTVTSLIEKNKIYHLVYGEVFFDVNTLTHVRLYNDSIEIIADSLSSFNIRDYYDQSISISIEKGKIEVKGNSMYNLESNTLTGPGRYIVNKNTKVARWRQCKEDDFGYDCPPTVASGWRDAGYCNIDGDIFEALETVRRWHGISYSFNIPVKKNEKEFVGGFPYHFNINSVVTMLEKAYDVKITKKNNIYFIDKI